MFLNVLPRRTAVCDNCDKGREWSVNFDRDPSNKFIWMDDGFRDWGHAPADSGKVAAAIVASEQEVTLLQRVPSIPCSGGGRQITAVPQFTTYRQNRLAPQNRKPLSA